MKKAFENYTLLAGGTGGKGSLWQGPEHLLVVEGQGWLLPYGEIYRRVDYDKIQALTLVPTHSHVWASLGFGLAAVLFGLLAFASRNQEIFLPISLAVPAVLLTVLTVVNLARGGTCRCSLQTAVQVLKLKPLVRRRHAEPVISALGVLCRQHQGGLVASGPGSVSAPPLSAFSSGLESIPGGKLPWMGSNWTFATGWVTAVWGAVLAGELFVASIPYTLLDAVLGATAMVLGIVTLVRIAKFRVPSLLLACVWVNVVLDFVAGLALYVMAVAGVVVEEAAADHSIPRPQFQEEKIVSAMSNFSLEQSGAWGWLLVGVGALLLLLGLSMVVYGGRSRRGSLSKSAAIPPPHPGELSEEPRPAAPNPLPPSSAPPES